MIHLKLSFNWPASKGWPGQKSYLLWISGQTSTTDIIRDIKCLKRNISFCSNLPRCQNRCNKYCLTYFFFTSLRPLQCIHLVYSFTLFLECGQFSLFQKSPILIYFDYRGRNPTPADHGTIASDGTFSCHGTVAMNNVWSQNISHANKKFIVSLLWKGQHQKENRTFYGLR